MGVPKNTDVCPFDNGCFTAGLTPKYVLVTFSGITKNDPDAPPPMNNTYRCEQIASDEWQLDSSEVHISFHWSPLTCFLEAFCPPPWNAFAGYSTTPCTKIVSNQQSYYSPYMNGFASFAWAGPKDAEDSLYGLAEAVGVLSPVSCQFETNGIDDDNQRVRIAQKMDHTCVYIKRPSD